MPESIVSTAMNGPLPNGPSVVSTRPAKLATAALQHVLPAQPSSPQVAQTSSAAGASSHKLGNALASSAQLEQHTSALRRKVRQFRDSTAQRRANAEIQAIEQKFSLPLTISASSDKWADGKISKAEFVAMLEAEGPRLGESRSGPLAGSAIRTEQEKGADGAERLL